MANVSPEIIFGMPFFILSGANVDFLSQELRWKTYTTKKALLTTKSIELIDKKEFIAAALDPESEIFVVHIASLGSNALPSSFPLKLDVHPFCRFYVSSLIAEEALTQVPAKYLDFADIFFPDLVCKPSEYTRINNHAIELVNS